MGILASIEKIKHLQDKMNNVCNSKSWDVWPPRRPYEEMDKFVLDMYCKPFEKEEANHV